MIDISESIGLSIGCQTINFTVISDKSCIDSVVKYNTLVVCVVVMFSLLKRLLTFIALRLRLSCYNR